MKKLVSLGFTAGLLLLLGGCYSASSSSSSTSSEAKKQEIAISLPTQLSTLDTTQTTDKNTFTIAQQIFEGLYRFDDDSNPVPGLAKSVDVSADGKTYTFHLRDNLKWSNGTVLTAADFVFAWKRLVDPATQGPNAYLLDSVVNSYDVRTAAKPVSELGISAPDDQTFVVKLAQAQPSFLSVVSIAWLAPQNEAYVTEQGDDYGKTSENLIYSGPFALEDWNQTGDDWTLVKNKNYYDAKEVKLATVHGSTVKEENTGINLYQSGELDLTRISGQYVQQYSSEKGFVSHNDVANYFLDFNKKAGTALANVHLRKAIAFAIDKTSLANDVLNDGSKALNGLIPANLYANPDTKEDFRNYSGSYNTYDLTEAKKEWQQAQADLGDSVKVDLLVSDDDNGKKISEYIQSQLQDNLSGLTITITLQPKNNVNQSRRDKNYELSLSGWIAGSSDLDSYFNLYKTGSAYNYGAYDNDEYTTLVEKARTTDANDPDKQFADYKQAEAILLEKDAAQVPLYQSASNYLINPKIKGIAYHLYGDYFNLRGAYVE
ncbi:peptide ABC transporter substrate-binding protein [uncultured Enterococcus sp.]|uniref:peptide ABC transporter substrate-binding protein n=1 Tax=uncultured Enterococcus sp. TaxID=167972 RepID=UPI0025917BCA|nr:peptide ABC transporter substrate-binding protein [uncultured Enterococcus sp.]